MRRQVKTAACAPGTNSSGKDISSSVCACGVAEYFIRDRSTSLTTPLAYRKSQKTAHFLLILLHHFVQEKEVAAFLLPDPLYFASCGYEQSGRVISTVGCAVSGSSVL